MKKFTKWLRRHVCGLTVAAVGVWTVGTFALVLRRATLTKTVGGEVMLFIVPFIVYVLIATLRDYGRVLPEDEDE